VNYSGLIIEESLEKTDVLSRVKVIKTMVEPVTKDHNTPYLKQWTMHTVSIPDNQIESVSQEISQALDPKHSDWYADFKNDQFHFIVFRDKVFKVDRSQSDQYQAVTDYGLTLGIPAHQLDFAPDAKEWDR
jgi:hypothetical protein